MATPHIEVNDKTLIAPIVLMPGDPLRAEFIANTYLDNVIKINSVRNMLGFTGYYQGTKVTVMASGMGMPSIGIYSYELFKFYECEAIIRIGSCGAYTKSLNLYDCFLAIDAYSESTFAKTLGLTDQEILAADKDLNATLIKSAKALNIQLHLGRIHSSDVFYRKNFLDYQQIRDEKMCMVVEMEAFALFANAKLLNKKAACLLTVSDNLETKKETTSSERQKSFRQMMEIALNAIKEV